MAKTRAVEAKTPKDIACLKKRGDFHRGNLLKNVPFQPPPFFFPVKRFFDRAKVAKTMALLPSFSNWANTLKDLAEGSHPPKVSPSGLGMSPVCFLKKEENDFF